MIVKWMTIILFIAHSGVVIPIIAHSFISMLRGNFDTATWYFPLSLDILLDSSNVFVWYLKPLDYIVGGYAYMITVLAVIPYLASCCFYMKASCMHLRSILDECDEIVSAKRENKDVQIEKILEKIKTVVLVHIKILE